MILYYVADLEEKLEDYPREIRYTIVNENIADTAEQGEIARWFEEHAGYVLVDFAIVNMPDDGYILFLDINKDDTEE